jgi:hypothetical protein
LYEICFREVHLRTGFRTVSATMSPFSIHWWWNDRSCLQHAAWQPHTGDQTGTGALNLSSANLLLGSDRHPQIQKCNSQVNSFNLMCVHSNYCLFLCWPVASSAILWDSGISSHIQQYYFYTWSSCKHINPTSFHNIAQIKFLVTAIQMTPQSCSCNTTNMYKQPSIHTWHPTSEVCRTQVPAPSIIDPQFHEEIKSVWVY